MIQNYFAAQHSDNVTKSQIPVRVDTLGAKTNNHYNINFISIPFSFQGA